MKLFVCGLNHTTANLALREKVAFTPEVLQEVLSDVSRYAELSEVSILSTCNRTEIYAKTHANPQKISQWLNAYLGEQSLVSDKLIYTYEGQEAIRHIMRVACGLDSMVIGEPQIFGQIKQAYAIAREAGMLSQTLNRLFEITFNVAKKVRTETEIGVSPISIAFAAVKLANQLVKDINQQVVLLVGAGETIELVTRHLLKSGVTHFIFANRTASNAQSLANLYSGTAIDLNRLPEYLPKVDLVFSATSSTTPIFEKDLLEQALKQRNNHPIFMVDLAVPRDFASDVANLEKAYLYTIDDLKAIVEENRQFRKDAALKAEGIIHFHAEHFMQWFRAQAHLDWLKHYRQQSFETRDEMLHHSLLALKKGESPELIIQRLAYQLTNKLIHQPTMALRQASETNDKIEIERLAHVLGIEDKK